MRGARHLAAALLSVSLVLGTAAIGHTPSAAAQSYQVGEPVVVTVPALNVRSIPSLSGSIITVLIKDEVVRVVGGPTTADGYLWFQIERAGVTIGWSVAGFISGTAPSPPDEPAPTTPPAGGYAYGASVTVATDLLNVRALPSITAQILTVYASGRVATITGEPQVADNITWYPVDNYGWVSGEYLRASGGGTTTPPPAPTPPTTGNGVTYLVIADLLNVRSTPGLGGAVVQTLPYGTQITRASSDEVFFADDTFWFSFPGLGWVSSTFLSGNPDTVYVTAQQLNVRSAPNTGAAIVRTLSYGQSVEVFASSRDANGMLWSAIDANATLWVAGQYISIRLPGQ